MQPERDRDAVRDAVKELLDRSPAFRSLPPERQREVASNTAAVARAMAEAEGATVRDVDFPAFVADLVHGVFEAIVDASIQQMEAYAEMVAGVAKTADRFREENVSADDARSAFRPMAAFPGPSATPPTPWYPDGQEDLTKYSSAPHTGRARPRARI